MTITSETANLLLDAIAYTLADVAFLLNPTGVTNNIDETATAIQELTEETFTKFCEENGITSVEEIEEKEPDIPDDVDETNYDPYIGQDWFDCYDEEW